MISRKCECNEEKMMCSAEQQKNIRIYHHQLFKFCSKFDPIAFYCSMGLKMYFQVQIKIMEVQIKIKVTKTKYINSKVILHSGNRLLSVGICHHSVFLVMVTYGWIQFQCKLCNGTNTPLFFWIINNCRHFKSKVLHTEFCGINKT